MLGLVGTENRCGDLWMIEDPGDGDLGRGSVVAGSDCDQGLDDLIDALGHRDCEIVFMGTEAPAFFLAPGVIAGGRGLPATELSGQQADGQWAIGHDAEAVLVAERHQVGFDLPAVEQIVLVLNADEARQIAAIALPEGFDDFPGAEVAAAYVAHLACSDHVVECSQCFFERRTGVEAMEEVEVDIVGLESGQAVLNAAHQVEASQTAIIGVLVAGAEDLGAEDDFLAFVSDGFADDGFRSSFAVEGAVDEVASQVDRPVDDLDAELLVVLSAKSRAQTDFGYFDTGMAQIAVFHCLVLCLVLVRK